MKKYFKVFYLLLPLLIMVNTFEAAAQSKQLKKARKKEYKSKMKEYKKKDYVILGSGRSLDVELLTYYDKLDDENNRELAIITENCPTLNLCSQKNLVDALVRYATLASASIKGRINTEGGLDAANAANTAAVRDRFYAAYEALVQKNVASAIRPSLAVGKKTETGYIYEGYYLINEELASSARQKALDAAKQALEETEMNIQWGKKLGDFIKEGFDTGGN